jgi:hypothetical protein
MPEIKIDAQNELAQGRYANIVSVTSQEREIVIDFMAVVKAGDKDPQGQLVSRIFLNRFTARELSELIRGVEENWEKRRFDAPNPPEAKA